MGKEFPARVLAAVAMTGAVLSGCSTPAAAPASAGAAQSASTDDKICRKEIPTGQYIAKTTCRTKAQWDKIDKLGDEQRRQAERDRRNPEAE